VSRAIQRQLQKQPVEIPPQWRGGEFGVLLKRCLSKSLKLRFQSVAEVMAELERPTRQSSGDDVAVSGVRQQVEGAAAVGEGVPVWWVAAVGGAFLLGAGLALVWWLT
jgi:hypothetical protein